MSWLILTIVAYFLLAVSALFDKYLLKGPIKRPKVYAFYLGILGVFYLALIPFGFSLPPLSQFPLPLFTGCLLIFGLYVFYKGIKDFEVSRIVPAVGSMIPVFILFLNFLFTGKTPAVVQFLALLFLILGMVLSAAEKRIYLSSFKISLVSALLLAIVSFLTKLTYINLSFFSGFILMRIGGIIGGLFFLFFREAREEIKAGLEIQAGKIFILGQLIGGGGFILQNLAIEMVPLALLPFINALESTRYLFLLGLVVLLSLKFPHIIKEEISKKALIQKIAAVFLIGIGLTLLIL